MTPSAVVGSVVRCEKGHLDGETRKVAARMTYVSRHPTTLRKVSPSVSPDDVFGPNIHAFIFSSLESMVFGCPQLMDFGEIPGEYNS